MATRNYVFESTIKGRGATSDLALVTWAGLLLGDDGQPLEAGGFADRSVQFVGVFGGATVIFEGSNNGADWHPLVDPQGDPISKTLPSLEAVLETTRFVRPRVSGGDGTTNITAILFARG